MELPLEVKGGDYQCVTANVAASVVGASAVASVASAFVVGSESAYDLQLTRNSRRPQANDRLMRAVHAM